MKPLQPCCEQWAKAHEPATDWEMYGACVHYYGTEPRISTACESVKFCPWCAKPKGAPTKPPSDLAQACYAVRARINGEWDDPALVEFGPLSPDTTSDVLAIVQKVLAPLDARRQAKGIA